MLPTDLIKHWNDDVNMGQLGGALTLKAAALPTTRITLEALPALEQLSGLRRLDLCGRHIPTETLRAPDVTALRHVTSLTAQGAYLTGAQLARLLSALPRLRTLNLAGCEIDAGVLAALASLAHLEELTLGIRPVDAEAHRYAPRFLAGRELGRLSDCTGLRALGLRGRDIGAEAVDKLAALPRLARLDVGETDVGDDEIARLSLSRSLHALDLDHSKVGDSGMQHLVRSRIKRLNLANTRVSPEGVEHLFQRTDWRSLNLSGLPLSRRALAQIGEMRDLESLVAGGVNESDAGQFLSDGAELPALTALSFHVGDDGELLTRIAHACPALRDIALGTVPPAAFEALARMRHLATVRMSARPGGTQAWAALSRIGAALDLTASAAGFSGELPPQLTSLVFGGEVGAAAMAAVQASTTLQRLDLRDASRLGQDDHGRIAAGGLGALRDVIAQNASLDDTGLCMLARLPQCEALYVSANPLTERGIEALRRHPRLHTLEVRDTALGDAIVPTLVSLARLHCLDVAGSAVTSVGLAGLAACPNIQSLGIDGRQFDGTAVGALGEVPLLAELYLYPPFDSAAIARLTALRQVREIRLMGVRVESEGVDALAGMPGLRSIVGSSMSNEAYTALRARRPDIWLAVDVDAPGGRAHRFGGRA